MWYFCLIVVSTVILNLGLFGLGRWIRKDDPPAAAALRGWTLFLLICATAWFFKFSAVYLAPALWLLLAAGGIVAFKTLPRTALMVTALGSAVVAALLAFPFLRYPHLLAYAYSGTDQWGYIRVAKWLLHHSVDELPIIDNKPGLDWVWFVLTVKDRPLVYMGLAAISATFGYGTFVAYYVFPAALISALFLSFYLADLPVVFPCRGLKALVGLGLAAQPILLLHLQYQFMGGTIAGLVFMLLIAALFQVQAWQAGDPLFFAFAALLSVILAGLYTVKIAGLSLAILGGIFGFCLLRQIRNKGWFLNLLRLQPANLWLAFMILLVPLCFYRIRVLAPEPLGVLPSHGQTGHVWAQFGSIFGITNVTPWYQPDGTAGWANPVQHHPPGSLLGVLLLGVLLAFFAYQCWRWLRHHHDITPTVVFCAILMVGYLAAPPRGNHWTVSRSLPVYGGALLIATASTALRKQRPWAGWFAIGLACLPLVRAAPSLWPYYVTPVNLMVDGVWNQPPEGNIWGCLAYAYFYEDTREIDWSVAPECFQAMTHYMPENLRPKMKRGP